MDEIVKEFLVESHENIDQMDRDLVELEETPDSVPLLSSIFRAIHTIKGTSGFLALGRLEKLTHVGENLLSQLRDGERKLDEPTTGALLMMVDAVRELLALIEETGADEGDQVDVDSPAAAIQAILDSDPSAPAPSVAAASDSEQAADEPEDEAVSEASADDDVVEPVEPVEAVETVAAVEDVEDQPAVVPAPSDAADKPAPKAAKPPKAGANGNDDDQKSKHNVMDTSVRVDVNLLDSLVQQVGELVLTRNQILQKSESLQDAELIRAMQRLDLVASELQEGVMKTRMQPIGQVWSKMPRTVRDLSRQLGRKVHLEMVGHETELDRTLLEALKGPLTHLVRNSLDHGIEPPEERLAAGKPEEGTLLLRAFHESGQVVVEITDDGKGMDPDKIGSIALSRGVISADRLRRMETKEILELIFEAGFSTAEVVTNVSGRGVGMDVVRTNIESIGGSVDITSQVGQGTTVRVRIPLTLAIIPALLVAEQGQRYAIPQASLVELVRLEGEELKRNVQGLAGSPVLRLRGRLLPLVHLSEAFGLENGLDADRESASVDDINAQIESAYQEREAMTIAVLQSDDIRIGLVVEAVHDTQEIVVKPVGRQLKTCQMYAGATIMGDGRVALILDVGGIAEHSGIDPSLYVAEDTSTGVSDRTSTLLVAEVSGQRAAMPLDDVARLEEFPIEQVEVSGSSEVVQYRGSILPLIRLASSIGLYSMPDENAESLSVVVYDDGAQAVGVVVDRVLDVAEAELDMSQAGVRTGVLGSVVVNGRVTDLIDLDTIVQMAGVGLPNYNTADLYQAEGVHA